MRVEGLGLGLESCVGEGLGRGSSMFVPVVLKCGRGPGPHGLALFQEIQVYMRSFAETSGRHSLLFDREILQLRKGGQSLFLEDKIRPTHF